MKRFVLFVLVAGLVLAVGSAWALTLGPTVSGTWKEWNDKLWDGDVYWDPPTLVGHTEQNLGTIVESSSYYPGFKATLTDGSGDWVTDVWFKNGQEWAAILIEVAGLKNNNYFGIYKKDDPTQWQQLFAGGQSASASTTVHVPWHEFGFYLATGKPGLPMLDPTDSNNTWWVWYSQSSLNKYGSNLADTNQQHFAFFQAKPLVAGLNAYILGVEDLPIGFSDAVWGTADRDYNDFVVYVANVPDASTWMLFLSGVPALALLRRKRA
jgi:hypothetical protein